MRPPFGCIVKAVQYSTACMPLAHAKALAKLIAKRQAAGHCDPYRQLKQHKVYPIIGRAPAST